MKMTINEAQKKIDKARREYYFLLDVFVKAKEDLDCAYKELEDACTVSDETILASFEETKDND
jgi:hypothetical protein